jgi:hypothetical protein
VNRVPFLAGFTTSTPQTNPPGAAQPSRASKTNRPIFVTHSPALIRPKFGASPSNFRAVPAARGAVSGASDTARGR